MRIRYVVTAAAAACALAVPVSSSWAHGEHGEAYVPWMDGLTEQRSVAYFSSARSEAAAADAPAAVGPGISGLTHVGNADLDNTVNSDLAFWGNLAYAGNYSGFRILNIATDQPSLVVQHRCNGPQNDVSVHEMGGRRFLFQSVDTPQTAEDCLSGDAAIVNGGRVGYEGVRVFDVTDPGAPRFIDMVQTACGSHTHTLVPDGNGAVIYVSSYPLGSGVTPAGSDTTPFGPEYRPCTAPHKKISVIRVSAPGGEFAYERKEQPLSDDTTPNRGFQACHDIQIFMPRKLAVASCAGDGQIWDISDPWNPTTDVEGRHTHVRSPSATDQFEFIHSGVVTWDGDYFAIMDETGGGVTANCFGSATTDGFYYFYPLVKPGHKAPELLSRYTIPRSQGSEVCVSHNATVVPIRGRNVMTAAYYQGGVSVVDFTNVRNPREIAFADLEDTTGQADEWSSYWYNGRIYSNSGLNRRASNRGFDVYRPEPRLGLGGAKSWSRSNPQTQEAWQAP